MHTRNMKNARGFNLVEASIILGVVGFVMGGVWVASAAVTENRRIASAASDVRHIVTHVRSLSTTGLVGAPQDDVTAVLARVGAVPSHMKYGTDVVSAWNKPARVVMGNDAVYVSFYEMSRGSCIKLLMQLSSRDREDGLSSATVIRALNKTTNYEAYTLASATSACNVNGVTVSLNYSLTGFKMSQNIGGGPSPAIAFAPEEIPVSLPPETM